MLQFLNRTALAEKAKSKDLIVKESLCFFCIRQASLLNVTEFISSFVFFNPCLKESIPFTCLRLVGSVFHNNGPLHLIEVLPISQEYLGNIKDNLSLGRVNFLLKWFTSSLGAVCW